MNLVLLQPWTSGIVYRLLIVIQVKLCLWTSQRPGNWCLAWLHKVAAFYFNEELDCKKVMNVLHVDNNHFQEFYCAASYCRHHKIIIIHFPYFTEVYLVLKRARVSVAKQFLFTVLAKNVLTIWHVLSITDFRVVTRRAGRRLSSVKLSCNLFVTIPVVDNTNDIPAIFSCPIHITSSFRRVYVIWQ